jgi:hypothetical protein
MENVGIGILWLDICITYFTAIWNILWQYGIFYGSLVYFMAVWYILWQYGIFYGSLV